MGCDIHGPFVFDKSLTGDTARLRATFRWDRDYTLFSALADVRTDGSVAPVAGPRGFPTKWLNPNNPGYIYQLGIGVPNPDPECPGDHAEYHGLSSDCHSMSWLSTDEAVEAQRRYQEASQTPNEDLANAIVYMRMLESQHKDYPDYRVVLVFCFDN